MFLLLNGSNVLGISDNVMRLVGHVMTVYNDAKEKFISPNALPAYMINNYNNAENYASQMIRTYKIIKTDGDTLLPANDASGYLRFFDYQGQMLIEGATNVTLDYFKIEQSTYDGPQKVFATVTKRGLKSTGMTVIVDPNLVGRNARTPEQYEELFGTFAKVKVTTKINANGWYGATLFLSADSLGDYRVETQQVSGFKTTFLV